MVAQSEMDPMVRARLKPVEEPFPVQVKKFLYNKESGAVMGRTASSWAKIILFYIIFYIVLAALFSILMLILYYTLDPRIPKYQLDESLIGTNPGVGFRPMPNDQTLSSLIWYRGTNRDDYAVWVDSLKDFVKEYKTPGLTPGRGQNLINCDYGHPVPEGKVCSFDVSKRFYPCVEENNFNYHHQKPCIFLKLNKIYGWKPEYYTKEDLPEKMPGTLMNTIRNITDANRLQTVWLSCEGSTAADVENLGEVQYLPQPGFPGYFFPYKNNEGYLPPLVAIVLQNPKTGILLNIECKAWAKNIRHDRKDKLGMVQFEVMID
ncbi:unnamed protein product [Nesidiocoris tenuis]|uniref:Uncharacterized protein n=2 Tax=Nesidiocoris tenuis TaxID=355587 RepID=A0A6H5FXP3_9HEMI|nr:Sodium potassium-transporting ATPase subunit [Nesidiocoris tenuis]CAA9994370.1 unnamed protein product [Nesidiocoris tenuis]